MLTLPLKVLSHPSMTISRPTAKTTYIFGRFALFILTLIHCEEHKRFLGKSLFVIH